MIIDLQYVIPHQQIGDFFYCTRNKICSNNVGLTLNGLFYVTIFLYKCTDCHLDMAM